MTRPRARHQLTALVVAGLMLGAGCGDDKPEVQAGPFVESGPVGPATVWAIGDAADSGRFTKEVSELVKLGKPDKLLYLGDVYPKGTAGDFEERYTTRWGSFITRTAPTPGNHEWPTRAEGYVPYWRKAKQRKVAYRYAFEVAGWEVISLNSEAPRGPDSEQVRWLRRQVREKPGDCRIAFWHTPRYSAGKNNGDDATMEPFWQALQGRTPLIINAHEHNMQRFKPRRGITELISGAGGHGERYPIDKGDPRLAFANDRAKGALRLRLRPGRADYAFVATDGRTLDSGSVRCRSR
jgi:Calcineurin-like phosphoesterase